MANADEICFSAAGNGHTMRITKDGFYLDNYLVEPSGERARELFEFMLEWASAMSDRRRIREAVERLRKLIPEPKYRGGDPLEDAVSRLEEIAEERKWLLREIEAKVAELEAFTSRLSETEAVIDAYAEAR